MANLRKQNGHAAPWKVTYWGVGNESWGCGGNMTPDFYADEFKRYATYARNYPGTPLRRIASGASVVDEDVLTEGFGRDAKYFFEKVFGVADFQQRGALIEKYLLEKLLMANALFLQECLYYIHTADNEMHLKNLAKRMRCSEKKIIRSFSAHFDLTPKDYMRIVKFRRALQLLNHAPAENLTSIAHRSSYYDQSHFIKDIKFFTEKTPKEIRATLHDVKQKVIIGLE